MKVYLDFDDYYMNKSELDLLYKLHEHFDNFKVNLFVVWEFRHMVDEFLEKDWVVPCLHGVNHTNFEEVSSEILDSWWGAKIWRSPYWQLTDVMYKRLISDGWRVMLNTEVENENRWGIYYNWNIKDRPDLNKKTLLGHGHITPYDNGLKESFSRLLELPKSCEFCSLEELNNESRDFYGNL